MATTPRQPGSPVAAILAIVGRVMLTAFFLGIITPVGLVLRMLGKDPLRLKRPQHAVTYWHKAKHPSPLKRLY
jgi:hypothetical protein